MSVEQVTEMDRQNARRIATETLGFGCTYADKRAGGRRRYKWIFPDDTAMYHVDRMKNRIITEISNETGMSDEAFYEDESPDYKIEADESKLTTPQSIRYQFITITI